MNVQYKKIKNALLVLAAGMTIGSCQKLSHPELPANYPKDANPPGGPLKFYAAMDSTNVDSIKANFGVNTNASIVPGGVSGKALQLDGSQKGYTYYSAPNDFSSSSSFTVSFWINITGAQKDNSHAIGLFAFANTNGDWSDIVFYADNNTKGTTDSMDLKIHFTKADGSDNWDFANYNFANAWPHMYDGNWHQVGFTYDAKARVGTVYRDGAVFDTKTNEDIAFFSPSQLILGGFQQANGVHSSYTDAANSWMAGFPGKMDNVRLYGVALSPSDIQALYTNKQ
jgi:hypothetical protein